MTPPNPTPECPIDFPLVILESPYAGNVEENLRYARACMRDCLQRGEAPYASLLYTQPGVLDDTIPDERSLGIRAGMAWGVQAEKTVVYVDNGISGGMAYGIAKADELGRPIEFRSLHYKTIKVFISVITTRQGIGGPAEKWTGYRISFDDLYEDSKLTHPWLPESWLMPEAERLLNPIGRQMV